MNWNTKVATKLLGSGAAVVAGCMISLAAVADQPAVVQASSLEVKERLHSIEQINVTAEKEQVDVAPVSEAVARLLEEAERADTADE